MPSSLPPILAAASLAMAGAALAAPSSSIHVGGCTLFDFARPSTAVPGMNLRYDGTGFWSEGSNGWIRQQAAAGRIGVDPHVRLVKGMRTIRLEVRPGDVLYGGERADVYYGGAASPSPPGSLGIGEGATQWWAWTTRTARTFDAGRAWTMLMDFHPTGSAPSTNVAVNVLGHALSLDVYGGDAADPQWARRGIHRVLGRFVPGRRYDFELGVHWSTDARVGWVDAWVNGRHAVTRTHVATMWRGQGVYAKLANYRPAGTSAVTNVVYDAGFRRGPSRATVHACVAR